MKRAVTWLLIALAVAFAGWRGVIGWRVYHTEVCFYCTESLCQGRCGIKSCGHGKHQSGEPAGAMCDRMAHPK